MTMRNKLLVNFIFNTFAINTVDLTNFKTKLSGLNLVLRLSTSALGTFTSNRIETIRLECENSPLAVKHIIELYKNILLQSRDGTLLYVLLNDIPCSIDLMVSLLDKKIKPLGSTTFIINSMYITMYIAIYKLAKWIFISKSIKFLINKRNIQYNTI